MWADNQFTVEGQHLHRKAHAEGTEQRRSVRTARGLSLRSFQLGVIGKADVVEFRSLDTDAPRAESSAVETPKAPLRRPTQAALASGRWSVVPVEYKRGKPKTNDSDRVQLCAQAICLEEMLGVRIPAGELYYGLKRRRTEVVFDELLRSLTSRVAARLHALIASQQTPRAGRDPKCESCSLLQLCMPDVFRTARPISALIERGFRQHLVAVGPASDEERVGGAP